MQEGAQGQGRQARQGQGQDEAAGRPALSARAELRKRLTRRRSEILEAVLARAFAIADPAGADPGYLQGLRDSVEDAVDFGLEVLAGGGGSPPPIPPSLRAQARAAARSGIGVDAVLRRYFAGYSVLGYFLLEEASCDGLMSHREIRHLLASQADVFDRLLAAVGEEHAHEAETRRSFARRRQVERIEDLLAGGLADASSLPYDFEGWHLGMAVQGGPELEDSLRDLASKVDCRLLLFRRGDELLCAWLGARRYLDAEVLSERLLHSLPSAVPCALGEPGRGLAGWRLTHRQAQAALPVARREAEGVVRYADVALVAALLEDDLTTTSMRRLYLDKLDAGRDGGKAARETLLAYFAADCNVSSAAAALGVDRHTVSSRLRTIERRLGRSLDSCRTELDLVLRLERHSAQSPAAC